MQSETENAEAKKQVKPAMPGLTDRVFLECGDALLNSELWYELTDPEIEETAQIWEELAVIACRVPRFDCFYVSMFVKSWEKISSRENDEAKEDLGNRLNDLYSKNVCFETGTRVGGFRLLGSVEYDEVGDRFIVSVSSPLLTAMLMRGIVEKQ